MTEENINNAIEIYNNLDDIEKQEFKSIIGLDDKSTKYIELLNKIEELKKLLNDNV